MRRDLAITPQGLAITGLHLTEAVPAVALEGLTAQERIALDPPPPRWRPWAWAVAIFLHVAAIAFLLLFAREKPPADQSPPGVSVVFENGGAPATSAPQAQLKGPTSVAQTPPPPAPPPPAAQSQPEVNLNMPDQPFATMQSAPVPQVQAKAAPRPRPNPRPAQKYTVMNDMSYGSTAVPTPEARHALNMDLAQSDSDAVNKPELAIKGDVGADWGAALSAWVNAHKYYPQAALEQHQQGSSEVEFTVDRAGNVTNVHLLNSAGSPFLDQAWTGLFAQNQLPPFPPGTKADHVTVDATMHYEIIN